MFYRNFLFGEDSGMTDAVGLLARELRQPYSAIGASARKLCQPGNAVGVSAQDLYQPHKGYGFVVEIPSLLKQTHFAH